MSVDIMGALNTLAGLRPVFHSEADFQHALAWVLHERHPDFNVRLEYRPSKIREKTYVDIWLERAGDICAIELKYKTRKLRVAAGDELFTLLDQSAQDQARYDYCRDIARIENLKDAYMGLAGFAIFLTNDRGYWRESTRVGNVDGAFRLHEAAKLNGELAWEIHASDGTRRGRTAAICLQGSYELAWSPYSKCGEGPNSEFRMAITPIGPG